MVGKSKLEKEILKKLEGLKIKYDNFDYMHIEKCSYPQMQYLQDISDVYLMLHRISIFDLTTLKVMKKGKCIILSDVGGNPEFNKENNIILCDNYEQCANDFINCNLDKLSIKNKEVYNQYFSQEQFKINYLIIMKDLLNSEMQYNVE
jgi:hypothetical protein